MTGFEQNYMNQSMGCGKNPMKQNLDRGQNLMTEMGSIWNVDKISGSKLVLVDEIPWSKISVLDRSRYLNDV